MAKEIKDLQNHVPLPHRLQDVRRAKLTFPHLYNTKITRLQKNGNKWSTINEIYLLSGQTQSPLFTLTLEDMLERYTLRACAGFTRIRRESLGTCSKGTGHPTKSNFFHLVLSVYSFSLSLRIWYNKNILQSKKHYFSIKLYFMTKKIG